MYSHDCDHWLHEHLARTKLGCLVVYLCMTLLYNCDCSIVFVVDTVCCASCTLCLCVCVCVCVCTDLFVARPTLFDYVPACLMFWFLLCRKVLLVPVVHIPDTDLPSLVTTFFGESLKPADLHTKNRCVYCLLDSGSVFSSQQSAVCDCHFDVHVHACFKAKICRVFHRQRRIPSHADPGEMQLARWHATL